MVYLPWDDNCIGFSTQNGAWSAYERKESYFSKSVHLKYNIVGHINWQLTVNNSTLCI